MKRYIYYCPKCGFLGSAEHENEDEVQACSQCGTSMYNTKLVKEMWDTYTKDERQQLKAEFNEAIKKSHYYKTGIDFERLLNQMEIQTHHLEVIMYVGLVIIAMLILILCKMIA